MSDREGAIERQVRGFLKEIAPHLAGTIEALDARARLWEVMDSLSLLDLVESLEASFKITIEAIDVTPDHFHTIQSITRFIARRTQPVA
ncbi:MAG TPA: acyl carrier protein [Polyangia bacterium]|jgi:acyl carrier protein